MSPETCQSPGCVCPTLAKAKYCARHVIDALGICPIKGCSRLPPHDRFLFCDECASHYERWVRDNLDEPSALRWLAEVGQ